MNENLKKIHEYLKTRGVDEDVLKEYDSSSVYLAMEIMEYAHRNQKRENGEDYANHPARCLQAYRDLVGIKPDEYFCMDINLMHKYRVPYDGVQEVCLLHDVVEDTEFTLEDVKDIYVECGFETHFDMFIKDALAKITHDKSVGYEEYIKDVIKNPVAALVKMIDMQDNLRLLDLVKFDEERCRRAQGYVFYTYVLNEGYHFLENIVEYNKAFQEANN